MKNLEKSTLLAFLTILQEQMLITYVICSLSLRSELH